MWVTNLGLANWSSYPSLFLHLLIIYWAYTISTRWLPTGSANRITQGANRPTINPIEHNYGIKVTFTPRKAFWRKPTVRPNFRRVVPGMRGVSERKKHMAGRRGGKDMRERWRAFQGASRVWKKGQEMDKWHFRLPSDWFIEKVRGEKKKKKKEKQVFYSHLLCHLFFCYKIRTS